MPLRLVQLKSGETRAVAAVDDLGIARIVNGAASTYALAGRAIATGRPLAAQVTQQGFGPEVDLRGALAAGYVLAPLDHPDPAHTYVTGTGLTHLGSAEGRDKMHKTLEDPAALTDSMKMFKLGLEGGRPAPGETGVQPEWFYKGDGSMIAAPESPLVSPAFAEDGGEEPEIVGLYLIGPDKMPYRLGFALGNEFSDHVMERRNYLYLAHSKLRMASFGPELLVGALPEDVRGTSRILRGGVPVWERPFLTGVANMSHTLANLEHHHFKYDLFRRPGDVHVHFFGTATLSFSEGFKTEEGDVFELSAPPFTLPLRNPLKAGPTSSPEVKAL
jgi:hypothetical protein